MSRRLTWWLAILLSCGFWFGAIYLGGKAAAAPVTDAPAFLAKRGLTANPVPVEVTANGNLPGGASAFGADGVSLHDRIVIEHWVAAAGGLSLASLALHEYLHQASFWQWNDAERDVLWLSGGTRLYEEGLVEAVTYDLLPSWWRYLTGKRLSHAPIPGHLYFSEVVTWRVWSARATGKPWRSTEAREWRLAALTWSPTERTDAANRITEENS